MNSNLKAYVALGLVCFFWGTTYLAARIGVSGFPALIFMGIRNTIAGSLLLMFLIIQNRKFIWKWRDVQLQIIPGLCMVTLGAGIVGWSVQFIPSGLAALICSTIPFFTITINLLTNKSEGVNWQILAGMLLGLLGVGFIFRDNLEFANNPKTLLGMAIALLSCVFWCLGGFYTKLFPTKTSSFFNASIQMLAGGTGLFVLSFFAEDWHSLPAMTARSAWALLYLILFGSILAFASYLYALSKLPAGLVSVYAYINPLVAIILGYIILNENITWITALAFSVTMSGVFLVNQGYKVQNSKIEIKTVNKSLT
jgi:drug/metabolite transporter (DMT)-like permease